ncbi:glycosyltransferase [Alteribacillus sp. JSM 102045]|uniref:MGDG synthase family glycosyltransferase n=1 Tax=Alteribacillus sp. JSM 102045 TaxID=1562101 RepID=UPI0035BF2511
MKKVLVMPFLQLSTGHHQVAKSFISWLNIFDQTIKCENVDIFSYAYGNMESLVSNIYMKSIDSIPSFYSWLYKKNAFENHEKNRFRSYELLFERAMLKLLDEKQPDFVICTHCLPSYILSCLKQKKVISIPVVNVYTDFFINTIWGKKGIDFHLVPDTPLKQALIDKGINREKIIVTGIPVHPLIKRSEKLKVSTSERLTILVSGGSLGVGQLKYFLAAIKPNRYLHYKILCGKNTQLYQIIQALNHPSIIPLKYIESRREMDNLYHQSDGIITKPGGVTISEGLYKKIPLFLYDPLPGQEEMNLQYLKSQGLAFHLHNWKTKRPIENQIMDSLNSNTKLNNLEDRLNQYHEQITKNELLTFFPRLINGV